MKHILITGGSGLLGRYVVERLKDKFNVTVLDTQKSPYDIQLLQHDILDLPFVVSATKNIDAIVHLAAIPHPLDNLPEEIVKTNVMGTFNMLEAAAQNGVKKFIFASSEALLGFTFMERPIYPAYVPIDELHPKRPQDPYGMSKLIGEEMCKAYTRRYGIQTICLRMPWIWIPEPEEQDRYRELIDDYKNWYKHLWAFVHVLDAAKAFYQAIARPVTEEHKFWFITADDNWTGIESEKLVRRFYPETVIHSGFLAGTASLISNKKAKEELGFRPNRTVQDVFIKE